MRGNCLASSGIYEWEYCGVVCVVGSDKVKSLLSYGNTLGLGDNYLIVPVADVVAMAM